MKNFLENPDEQIAQFGDAMKKKKKNMVNNTDKNICKTSPRKEKNEGYTLNTDGATSQIRISKSVELAVRESLLSCYKRTGKKMSFRQYADDALLAYLSVIK